MNLRGTTRLPKSDEPSHAPEWRWPAFLEINVNSRHPVMAVVRQQPKEIHMRRVSFVALQGSFFVLIIAWPLTSSGQPAEKPDSPDSVKAIKQVVTALYDNLSQGKADGNKKLFLN